MTFSRFSSNGSSPREFKAEPITFMGFHFPCKLEAYFAHYLDYQGIRFVPHPSRWSGFYPPDHPSRWNGFYHPDFYLPEFELFVEVKPKSYLHELWFYSNEILNQTRRWICVDRLDREWHGWHLIDCNPKFPSWANLTESGDTPRIEFYRDKSNHPELKVDFPLILNGWKMPRRDPS